MVGVWSNRDTVEQVYRDNWYTLYKESLIRDKNRNGGRAVWKYDDPVVVIWYTF